MSSNEHDHDHGLEFDVQTLLARRHALRLMGGASLLGLVACSADTTTSAGGTSSSSSSSSSGSASGTPGAEVPDETGGPFPGDGSNGPNVLDDSGIVRSDVTTSFGTSTTRAEGVQLTVNLTVTDASKGYAAMAGAAVYVWHCDREGGYSMYGQGLESENYLRGVQPTNGAGTATFTTVFPGAYAGRWPHIHFEVYASVNDATSSGQIVKTSQLALPQAACQDAYATAGYEQSVQNMGRSSITDDNVFGEDGGIYQLATVTGDAQGGYVANLTIGV